MRLLRLVWFLMTAGLLVVGSAVSAQAIDTSNHSNVNLRTGPGTGYGSLGMLEANTPFRADGRNQTFPFWLHGTTAGGQVGWIASWYTTAPDDAVLALPVMLADGQLLSGGAPPEQQAAPPEQQAAPPPADNPPAQAVVAPPPTNTNVISNITGTTRQIFEKGQGLGLRANVFTRVGDSLTDDLHFLSPFGWGAYNLRDYGYLYPVVAHFASGGARTGNSFSNDSLAAAWGWTTVSVMSGSNLPQVCDMSESWLACEYRVNQPAVALIMLGTNDVQNLSPDVFRANIAGITQYSIDRGVIPVLSTIPWRYGYEGMSQIFNQIITETALAYGVPLWKFDEAVKGLPNGGHGSDGVHLSYPPGTNPEDFAAAADFTPENLQYGYTLRNLNALQVLDAVWRGAMY